MLKPTSLTWPLKIALEASKIGEKPTGSLVLSGENLQKNDKNSEKFNLNATDYEVER